MKADSDFTINSFSGEETLEKYRKAVFDIGLWESEKIIFEKYMDKNAKVLDIGCGAGRTTFGLYKLGFRNLIGVDITPGMIESAKEIQSEMNTDIRFEVGDACNLEFADETFNHCIFSFNGFMQIPQRQNRIKAMKEINHVLKTGGIFIFTTHDREKNADWLWFWEEEKKRWDSGIIDTRIFEYGDRIIPYNGREIFLHFPVRDEILQMFGECGFTVVEDAWVFDIADEPENVRRETTGCRFWVARKDLKVPNGQ